MKRPESPAGEKNRIASLCGLEILDTPQEERFDRITRIAQQYFKVKICLVSLVDTDRQWFKSKQGLDATETPRDISFCGHAILSADIFHIPNALEDPRFVDNPLVTGPPNIRFYAGAPLHAPDGQRIGTLCIIDDKPRDFSSDDLAVLRNLADDVEKELGKRLARKTFTIQQKLISGSVVLMLLTAGVVGGLFHNRTTDLLAEYVLEDISKEIQNAGDMLNAIIDTQGEDVLFLASTPPVQGILRAQSEDGFDTEGQSSTAVWEERLQTIFRSQLQRKSTYLSIRYIDVTGQELVAVSRKGNKIVASTGEQLQSKAARTYVREALKLPAGSVYVSEMNLNREYGKVSLPHQEVIRSATPVYDARSSSLAGLVSITGEIGGKLRTIQDRVRRASSNEIYITNSRGDYLLHPDSGKTYGFDLDKAFRIQDDFPRLSSLFLSGSTDSKLTFWYEDENGRQLLDFSKVSIDPVNPARFISIVIAHDYSSIVAEQSSLLNDVVLWALLLSIVGIGVSILFAVNLMRPINQITVAMSDYIHQRDSKNIMPVTLNNEIGLMARSYQTLIGQVEEAHARLRDSNKVLEIRVAERTNALKMSESRQRSIVENVVDGLITIDASGVIASFNPAATRLFGYTADEVLGNNIKMLMPEPYASEHDGYLHNYLTTGEKKIIGIGREVTGMRNNGTTFPMELAVSEMQVGNERMFTGIVRDITERKKMEMMKSEFVSTVSHELRTPLTSIRGALGLVLGGASGELPEKARKMLEVADRNSERLTLLINDILDLEKIESGKIQFEFKQLDIVQLSKQAVEANQAYATEYNVRLVLNTDINQFEVYADDNRLLQVFANLISNAVKFSPEQGVVEVSLSEMENGCVRVTVRDHGAGIPEEFRSRIFQRFAQADSSDAREKGGTGLGLSISKVIITAHNGLINFLSPDDGGTEFYFELSPVHGDVEAGDTESQVLICEDNTDVAHVLKDILGKQGITTDIASNAASARQLLSSRHYQALLLDLGLPDEDGIEMIRALRQAEATASLPIIVVSARANESRSELSGSGVEVIDWIQKPFEEKRLMDSLRQVMLNAARPKILHIEDDTDVIQVVRELLRDKADYEYVTTLADARSYLKRQPYDLVILDIRLPDGSGFELMSEINDKCPVIVFSVDEQKAEDIQYRIEAHLTKATTSNERLLATVMRVMEKIREKSNE